MSSANTPNVESLTRQMEDILRETDALMASMARARQIRFLIALAVLAFVVVTVFAFYRMGKQFTSEKNLNDIATVAQRRLNNNSERYMREVQTLVNNVSPVISTTFTDEVRKELPNFFKAIEKEEQPLIDSLQTKLGDKLIQLQVRVESKQEKMLQEAFPELQDEKIRHMMVANMHKAVERLIKKYAIDEMQKEMNDLFKTWDQFPQAKQPGKGEDSLEDQFIANLLIVLKDRLAHVEGAMPAAGR